MKITFWGTRGSISVPDPDYMKYGGDTSCVEVRLEDNTCFIFDSGTGIRNCGNRLIESPPKDNKINLILSHTHWDHIQGFPFFAPVFNPIFEIEMMGLFKQDGRLHDTLSGQMDERYFPVNLSYLPSRFKFRELIE